MPKDKRDDMVVFYAFCRTMDDLVDAPGLPAAGRARTLDMWENGILHGLAKADAL